MKIAVFDGSNFSHISFHRAKSIVFKNKIKEYAEEHVISEKEAKKYVQIEKSDYEEVESMSYLVFFRKFHKYLKIFSEHKWIVAWDNPTSSDWRREIFPEYKGNRDYNTDPIWKDVMFPIMDNLKWILQAYPVYQFIVERLEADDIAYLIAKKYPGKDTVLISTDSDWIQTMQEFGVKLFNPLTDKYKKVPEYNYILHKAIVGDKGDNIPGLVGYGPKKAEKLTEQLSNKNLKETPATDITQEQQQIIMRNLKLMGIGNNPLVSNPQIDFSIPESPKKIDLKKIQKFYFDYKLKSLLEHFDKVAEILS